MDVKIEKKYPPNIDKIREHLVLGGNEIFAWDGIIYNPSGGFLTVPLIEHEKVHFKQQNGEPEKWWDRYLADPEFRLEQELQAHQTEYRVYCRQIRDRNKQAQYLFGISRRLASPMYGNILSQQEAMKRIRKS